MNDGIAAEEEIKEENSMFSLSDKSDDELENVAQSELTQANRNSMVPFQGQF